MCAFIYKCNAAHTLSPPLLVFRCESYSVPIAKLHKNNNMRQYLRRRQWQPSISYLINERCDPIAHLGPAVFPRSLYKEPVVVHPLKDVEKKWSTPSFYPPLFLLSSPTSRTTSVRPSVRPSALCLAVHVPCPGNNLDVICR